LANQSAAVNAGRLVVGAAFSRRLSASWTGRGLVTAVVGEGGGARVFLTFAKSGLFGNFELIGFLFRCQSAVAVRDRERPHRLPRIVVGLHGDLPVPRRHPHLLYADAPRPARGVIAESRNRISELQHTFPPGS